ncbi:FHA domain-containing protein [Pendulispora albinea]|uniref:FHA domain-containing protein n=1 Tax=Pendulispora albinea TaxID=2741071 RepID=A0ABZ2LUW8_9BACT
MIVCPKCSKENQDHYKFCLGCGAELPREAAPKAFSSSTPPHGVKAASAGRIPAAAAGGGAPGSGPSLPQTQPIQQVASIPTGAPPPMAQSAAPAPSVPSMAAAPAASPPSQTPPPGAAGGSMSCPQCGHMNAANNVFCGSCGFRLGAAPVARSVPAPAPAVSGSITLTALRADGSEAGNFTLPSPNTTVGRDTGGIFAGDSYLSPRHASFRQANARLHVRDEGSLNGVYRKLLRDAPVELQANDIFRIGQEIIRFEPLNPLSPSPDGVERLGAPSKGYVGRIALIIGRDTTGNAFPVPEAGVHLGRERGDILFPEDGYVSGLHCHLAYAGGKLTLTDLGSSNGTFLRLREEVEVQNGDVLLMGQQLFRITM